MKDNNAEIGLRIFKARKNLKMTRVELGKKVNLHESTVKRYEDGQIKSLDIEKIKEFAHALNLDASELLGWENKTFTLFAQKGTGKSKIIQDIIKSCEHLNEKGQIEALKRVEELTYIPIYVNHQIETIAAHNDLITEDKNELEKIKEDIEDMKNW